MSDERRPVFLVTPPPVEASAMMIFGPDGSLRAVELDGAYYACTPMKRGPRFRQGDTVHQLVQAARRTPGQPVGTTGEGDAAQ